ncbi:MAG: PepSY domain-containing protein [Acidobacteria bacterium]|nr:PepSY domain-containing protein [Acidobacteriota bacterium]
MKRLSIIVAIVIGLMFGINTVNAQTKKIGMAKARAIAAKQAAGKIESSELEKEGGKWIYSFDIRNGKGTITEVNVNAYTGAIVKVEEENKKAEADEKRKEKSEKKTKSGKQ